MEEIKFASRAGEKLAFALEQFGIDVKGLICADFGCSTGGFTDVMLQNGAEQVYAVDTAYGELAWKLRNDSRVVVKEKSNAMHIALPEKVDFLTVDTSWTKQQFVLPNAIANTKENARIVSLIKPHYEADKKLLHKGKLLEEDAFQVTEETVLHIEEALPLKSLGVIKSPIVGKKGDNAEYLVLWKKI
jgi:23S rRNA (cytidine1920-2'-O)/16S rRNA (cytidine1409-2'-O)-methyltransferase